MNNQIYKLLAPTALCFSAPTLAQGLDQPVLGSTSQLQMLAVATDASEGGAAPEATSNRGRRDTAALEEVIVTATKRSENLRDIPVSIAVIGTEDIERRGLIGAQDYLRSVPGVNQIDIGGVDNSVVIRGINTSPQFENFSAGPTVATYFDETSLTGAGGVGAGGIDIRPVDLERIEILRGPQGTTFGSAALGGAMRLLPARPKLGDFGAKVEASYGSTEGLGSDNSMIQGMVNIPVAEDFAVRAVGYRYEDSGYYRNVGGLDPTLIAMYERYGAEYGSLIRGYTQTDVGRMRSTGGRLGALWQPTEKVSLALNYLTQTIEQDGTPGADAIGGFNQSRPPVVAEGRLRGQEGTAADTDLDLASAVLGVDVGWGDLTTVVSWIETSAPKALDLTRGLGYPVSNIHRKNDFESFTAEARIASKLQGPLQFLTGVFYENTDEDYLQELISPGTISVQGTSPAGTASIIRSLKQRAVFGEVSYNLTEKLKMTAGGRYFDYDKDQRFLRQGGVFGTPITGVTPTRLESSEDGSTLKANISYEPSADSMVYLSWAQGFRLGRPDPGASPTGCDTNNDGLVDGSNVSLADTREIDSDTTDNYEIGGKIALLDRRMTIDVAAYHIDWTGLPIATDIPVPGCPGYIANAGEATSDGAEFQISLALAKGLRLDFGAGYTKAELSKPGLGAPEGARLPGSPQINANLSAQYDFDFVGQETYVRADAMYTDEYYTTLRETPSSRSGDYTKIDARTGMQMGQLSFDLFVKNLTNEDAITWGGALAAYRLRPRTYGVQLGYSFE